MTTSPDTRLSEEIERIRDASGARAASVALHDYRTGRDFSHRGDVWVHAASTIKVPVLVGVFAAVEAGSIGLDSRVHVRNRFLSVADGRAFRVEAGRDSGSGLHAQIGKTVRVRELARQMIVTSSNLATNLLVDLIGIDSLQETLVQLGVRGIELRRGVEDEPAFEAGINNRATAEGLVGILRLIEEGVVSDAARADMLEILHAQEFRSGIPAGLPAGASVAHKTGEISTVTHDAGLVYLGDRAPYAVAILTEWEAEGGGQRRETLALLSRAVHQHLCADEGDD